MVSIKIKALLRSFINIRIFRSLLIDIVISSSQSSMFSYITHQPLQTLEPFDQNIFKEPGYWSYAAFYYI